MYKNSSNDNKCPNCTKRQRGNININNLLDTLDNEVPSIISDLNRTHEKLRTGFLRDVNDLVTKYIDDCKRLVVRIENELDIVKNDVLDYKTVEDERLKMESPSNYRRKPQVEFVRIPRAVNSDVDSVMTENASDHTMTSINVIPDITNRNTVAKDNDRWIMSSDEDSSNLPSSKYLPNTVFISGMSNFTTEDDVRNLFRGIGNVVDIEMPIKESYDKRRHTCFVRFADLSDTNRVLDYFSKGAILLRCRVKIRKALNRNDRSRY